MDEYEEIVNQINKFLNEEEINFENTKEEVISVYTLYKSIDDELKGLRELELNKDKICTKVKKGNDIDSDEKPYVFKVDFLSNLEKSRVSFNYRYSPFDENTISITKDKNNDNIYINESINEKNKKIYKFIKKNFDSIFDILTKIEKYTELLGISEYYKDENNIFEFNYKLFNCKLIYNSHGLVKTDINIDDEEFNKYWFDKQSIFEIVEENKKEILKRIPISVYEIPNNFLKIYNQNKETKKEKEFVKRIKWWN